MSQLDRTIDDDVVDYSAENMYQEFENSTAATVRGSTCQETAKRAVPMVEESPPSKRAKREPPSSDFPAKFSKLASEYSKDCVSSAYKTNTRAAASSAANESPVRTPDRNMEAATTTGSDTLVNDAPRHDEASQHDEVSQGDDVLLRVKVEHADTSQHNESSQHEEACQRDEVSQGFAAC
ncbi:MAG: hypothetical protein ABW185_00405 [Sedimenticola sp.]